MYRYTTTAFPKMSIAIIISIITQIYFKNNVGFCYGRLLSDSLITSYKQNI